jgi:hypothetical protein
MRIFEDTLCPTILFTTSLFKKGLSENGKILDLRTLSPNPVRRDKHKPFKKKFDQKPA